MQGPLLGSSISLGLLLVGFILSSIGVVDIGVDTPSFKDSLLVSTGPCGVGCLLELYCEEELSKIGAS